MFRRVVGIFVLAGILAAPLATSLAAQGKGPEPTLKGILLAQLKSTHTSQEWFVTTRTALAGVTVDQAKWKDEKGNHSIGQLAYHLWYWNSRNLQTFKGE